MGYADTLLADGEAVVLRTRQHPLAFIKDSRNGLLLWLLAILLLVGIPFFNVTNDLLRNVISIAALACLLVGLLIVVWQYLLWWTEEYIVTNRRLLKVNGVVNKRSEDSSLEKINDAILSIGLWGRIFNYGDLDILTASEQQVDSYRMLNGAKKFKITMLNEKHALEMEYAAGRVPTAPIRATTDTVTTTTTAPAPMAPPPGPPPPPPAPVDASLEVTQTLARLADLRDRGAISAEDYEAKKAELLGRL